MRRTLATLAALAIAIFSTAGAHAVNPATWQINEQVNRSDSTKTWTSPTAVDLGKMLWKYDYEITKVTGWVNVIVPISRDITNTLPPDLLAGGGQSTNLPAVLLQDSIADSGTGTTADLLVEITQSGFGKMTFSNIKLGSISISPFGSLPIQRVDVEATIRVTGYRFGDYDLNGVVNGADYTIWKQAFQGAQVGFADGNLDGVVNAADYTVWRDAAAGSGGSGALAAVPEPATWLLFLGAFSVLAVRIRS